MNLGIWELVAIFAVALLFFGPSRLPGLGKSLGEAIRGFKGAMSDVEKPAESTPAPHSPANNSSAETSSTVSTESAREKDPSGSHRS